MCRHRPGRVQDRSAFAGFRFPPEVITVAVRWYLRYGLSYRDAEELLAERGIEVDHVSVFRWVQRFTPLFADAARPCRHAAGDRWWVDETYIKVGGRWCYLYRAIDQFGQVIDVLATDKRDAAAARHITERYGNNRIEADHGRLKARLRPMRWLKRLATAAVIAAGHAFVQNIRRGHYELAVDVPPALRLVAAFTELARAI